MNVLDVIHAARSMHSANRPFVVAIDGLSGAGKTTFVSHLNGESDLLVLHIDDYIVERAKRYETGQSEPTEYYALQRDVSRLECELFRPLTEGVTKLILPRYDYERDVIVEEVIDVSSAHTVVVEGIFLQRSEWRPYYDYVIYLDCPRDVRYERVLNRDTYLGVPEERLAKYKRRYWPGEDLYLQLVDPKRGADIVL
ncbi:kinase [Exiguobacterium aestuarii]|uniref:kinase n=1 Tax=Exiguobacterium aestuarii TaxID=273527 RepID=UPI001CD3AF0E|nr:kinase [Exiguobacterium aestuarii]MCA0982030.1 AAA family ATPase [Exiguobacterium aestuarii]